MWVGLDEPGLLFILSFRFCGGEGSRLPQIGFSRFAPWRRVLALASANRNRVSLGAYSGRSFWLNRSSLAIAGYGMWPRGCSRVQSG
jgi:hypothetical protein